MKKYIDADRLKAEIERLTKTYQDSIWRTIKGETAKDFRDKLLSVIDSLQQEQQEVDLEKEIEEYFPGWAFYTGWDYDDMEEAARHFFNLGLNARKEKKV